MKQSDLEKIIDAEIARTSDKVERIEQEARKEELLKNYQGEDKIVSWQEISDRMDRETPTPPMSTGYQRLDFITGGGFGRKQLVALTGITKNGKCLTFGTNVLLYNGSIKQVQDIVVGDKIMGINSQPRTVLSLGRGREEMFKVTTKWGSYTCNASHILSLKRTGTNKFKRGKPTVSRKGELLNISVREYLEKSEGFKHVWKAWRTGVDWEKQEVPVDPYFLGVWLGNGTTATQSITNKDNEVAEFLRSYSQSLNGVITEKQERGCFSYRIKDCGLLSLLKDIGVIGNKHIPQQYKINDRETRLQVLAGLIDTDGHLEKSRTGKYGKYEITQKSERLADDIFFLASSLGFSVTRKKVKKGIKKTGFVGEYIRLSISGSIEEIPVKVVYKKYIPHSGLRKQVQVSSFTVESVGMGDYYGFELDGDGLFLLGNFVVTHNTAFAMQLTRNMAQYAPLWFPFEETAEELIKKQKEYGNEIPHAFSPLSFPTEDLKWVEERIVESIIKNGTRIVLIDHLHFLVKSFGEKERLDLKLTEIVSQLKRMAKRLDVCIILVVHLRKVAIHEQPTINDIKETSSIAQWADKTIIVWREAQKSPSGILTYSGVTNVTLAADRQTGMMESVPFTFDRGTYKEGESAQQTEDILMGTYIKDDDYGKI